MTDPQNGREALRARLAEAAMAGVGCRQSPDKTCCLEHAMDWPCYVGVTLDALWPLIEADREAYGDERAEKARADEATGCERHREQARREGAEKALRDAATHMRSRPAHGGNGFWPLETAAMELEARADEIRGRRT